MGVRHCSLVVVPSDFRIPEVRFDRVPDSLGIRHVTLRVAGFESRRRVVIARLSVLEQAREDRRELAREGAGPNEVLVEGSEHLRVTAERLPTRQERCGNRVNAA